MAMDPTPTEMFNTTGKGCSGRKTQQAHPHYYVLPKLVKAYTVYGNAEVERRLSENSKVRTSKRSLLSHDSINAIQNLTKDAL